MTRQARSDDVYAFFSQRVHDELGGKTTVQYREVETDKIFDVNWVGSSSGGFPCLWIRNSLVRPPHYETFACIGLVAPGRLQAVGPRRTNSATNQRGQKRNDLTRS